MSDNAHEHQTITLDGYEVTLHPAFSSRCSIRTGDTPEREIYRQQEKHVLPNGASHPQRHVVRLKGGAHNRDLELVIKDPKHHVARIIVELHAEGHRPGTGTAEEPVETMTVDNFASTCPPDCD